MCLQHTSVSTCLELDNQSHMCPADIIPTSSRVSQKQVCGVGYFHGIWQKLNLWHDTVSTSATSLDGAAMAWLVTVYIPSKTWPLPSTVTANSPIATVDVIKSPSCIHQGFSPVPVENTPHVSTTNLCSPIHINLSLRGLVIS